MRMKITDAVIRDHMPRKGEPRVEIIDSDMPGLEIRLQDGMGTWTYRTPRLPNGKRPRVEVGYWPNKKAADARLAAQAEKEKVRTTGRSTNVERRERAARAKARRSLTDLAEDYYLIAKLNAQEEHSNVTKALVEQGIGDLTPAELKVRHAKTIVRGPNALKRFGCMSRFIDHLVSEELIEANPFKMVANKDRPKHPEASTRVYNGTEYQRIWNGAGELPEPFNDFVRFVQVVPLRRDEGASLQAEWITGNLLRIPGLVTKNGDPFDLRLGPLAMEIIAKRPKSGPLFPSRKTGRPISGWKCLTKLFRDLGIDDGGVHHFRRTCATVLAESGFRADVADSVLNHRQSATRSGVLGTYNRSRLDKDRASAMARWDAEVRRVIETGEFTFEAERREKEAGDNVVPWQG